MKKGAPLENQPDIRFNSALGRVCEYMSQLNAVKHSKF